MLAGLLRSQLQAARCRAAPVLLEARRLSAEPARAAEPLPEPGTSGRAAAQPAGAQPLDFNNPAWLRAKSTGDIVRSLLVFQACKFRPLVTHADSLLKWSKRLFGSRLVDAAVGAIFYKQFVAGPDAAGIVPAIQRLKDSGIHSILDYAAEDDVGGEEGPGSRVGPQRTAVARTYSYSGEALCDQRMAVFRRAIDAAAAVDGQGFAAIKVTALGLPSLLERVSLALVAIQDLFRRFDAGGSGRLGRPEFRQAYRALFSDDGDSRMEEVFSYLDRDRDGQVDVFEWCRQISVRDTAAIAARCRERGPFAEAALSGEEVALLDNMMARVDALASIAAEAGVRLMVDAEYTYLQPAIDHAVTELQRKHNRQAPTIFNTYQCYLRNTHTRLLTDLERAQREGFHLGVKLVRGAYMMMERERAERKGAPSPIWDTIEQTHAAYNECAAELIRRVPSEGVAVMVASHNQESVERAVGTMAELGLPPSSPVYFGTLLGMADHLAFTLGAHGYGAYKYVPFGTVSEVMPYLIRRAQENGDVLGGVGKEVAMLRAELRRRLLPGAGPR